MFGGIGLELVWVAGVASWEVASWEVASWEVLDKTLELVPLAGLFEISAASLPPEFVFGICSGGCVSLKNRNFLTEIDQCLHLAVSEISAGDLGDQFSCMLTFRADSVCWPCLG